MTTTNETTTHETDEQHEPDDLHEPDPIRDMSSAELVLHARFGDPNPNMVSYPHVMVDQLTQELRDELELVTIAAASDDVERRDLARHLERIRRTFEVVAEAQRRDSDHLKGQILSTVATNVSRGEVASKAAKVRAEMRTGPPSKHALAELARAVDAAVRRDAEIEEMRK